MTSDAFWQLVMTILNHRFIKFHDQKQEPSESRAFLGLASAAPEEETETLWRLYGQHVKIENSFFIFFVRASQPFIALQHYGVNIILFVLIRRVGVCWVQL